MILILCKFSDHALNLYQFMKIPRTVSEVRSEHYFQTKNTKGNNAAKLQVKQWLLFSVYHLMLLHICSVKVSLTVQSLRIDTIFILYIPKENNYENKMVELWFLFSAYCPMKLYICSKFHENIDDRFKVIEWIRF